MYPCRRCGREFLTISGIRRHQIKKHNVLASTKPTGTQLHTDAKEVLVDGYEKVRKVWQPSSDEIEAEVLQLVSEDT